MSERSRTEPTLTVPIGSFCTDGMIADYAVFPYSGSGGLVLCQDSILG